MIKINIYYFLHFSFSFATKNAKMLLQAREVLNFERHPSIVCISSPKPPTLPGKPIVERCIHRHLFVCDISSEADSYQISHI